MSARGYYFALTALVLLVLSYVCLLCALPVYYFKPFQVLDSSRSCLYFSQQGPIAITMMADGSLVRPDAIVSYEGTQLDCLWRKEVAFSLDVYPSFLSLAYDDDDNDIDPDARIYNPIILIKIYLQSD